jgi:pyruvate formate lyase activating enzyme
MATVLRDKAFYTRSGGGITLSGGEPFMHPELAFSLLKPATNRDPHRR